MSIKLLNNVSVDTTGDAERTDGGSKTVAVWATNFGGGTVAVQGSPDGGTTWITLSITGTPVTYSSNEIRMIDRLGQGMMVRAVLSGSSGASNVNVQLFD